MARDSSTKLPYLDAMNPRILSNNLLLPYVIAIWEEFFRSTFAAAFKYSSAREATLKRTRLTPQQLEQIRAGLPVEIAVAESLSFQRPSVLADNFRSLDPKINLAAALRRPFRNRKITLFESIESTVADRNKFVHTGEIDLSLSDKELKRRFSDSETAVDRAYQCIASRYGFKPRHDF